MGSDFEAFEYFMISAAYSAPKNKHFDSTNQLIGIPVSVLRFSQFLHNFFVKVWRKFSCDVDDLNLRTYEKDKPFR